MAVRVSRSDKVRMIFQQFDSNWDGNLDRSEMAALIVTVNPRVKFSDEINAILDEVLRTSSEFIDGDLGLTLEGLVRTYDDGAGDVDRDFDALGFSVEPSATPEKSRAVGTGGSDDVLSSSIVDERMQVKSQKKQRTALEILVKRLKAKQAKDGKLKWRCLHCAADKTLQWRKKPRGDASAAAVT